MNVHEFCVALDKLTLNQPARAVAILWYLDREAEGSSRTTGELSRLMRDAGLGHPHSTRFADPLVKTGHVLKSGDRFRIKPTSRAAIAKWVESIVAAPPPEVDQDNGYLPKAVWQGTRSYVEKIASQINGCYAYGFYDGASVLIRRLVETLLIECYEHKAIQEQIKNNGDYLMLGDIIKNAINNSSLPLGRETKRKLQEVKVHGDRSAHNRHYTANRADLDKLHSGVRLAVEDLLHVCGFK